MSTSPESPRQNSTYFITSDVSAEIARLIDQDRLITEHMGELLPAHLDCSTVKELLDVACGPGGWARDVAHAHPDMQIMGIDINASMIEYAQAFAQVQGLRNIQFRVMDALQPLAFPDAAFDVVNGRLLMSFTLRSSWPPLLQELKRILRPGGLLCLTEAYDGGSTNSAASEQLKKVLLRAFYLGGRSFDSEGQSFGITNVLTQLLTEAGFAQLGQQEHVVDVSYGKAGYQGFLENNKLGGRLVQPFLVKSGLATQEELDRLYDQMLEETYSTDFRGYSRYIRFWGKKPAI